MNHIKIQNEQLQYVTLDYPRIRALAKEDPELFLQQYQPPLIIDEIQYAPELLSYIKIRTDWVQQNGMYSLSRAEIEGRESEPFLPDKIEITESIDGITDIFEKIYQRGMPRMVTDKELLPEDYFGAYMQTYLERDIRDLITVKDENKFLKSM